MRTRINYFWPFIFLGFLSCSRDPIGPLFVYKDGFYGLKDQNGKIIVESKIAAIGNEPNRISTGNQYFSWFYSWNSHATLQWMNVGGTQVTPKKGIPTYE
jgi:hypothetical protein